MDILKNEIQSAFEKWNKSNNVDEAEIGPLSDSQAKKLFSFLDLEKIENTFKEKYEVIGSPELGPSEPNVE